MNSGDNKDRWHSIKGCSVTNSDVDEFLEEIKTVCIKHGYSIGHEDGHGSFLIEKYTEEDFKWLNDAGIGYSIED